MDATIWWREFVEVTAELLRAASDVVVQGVGVSGMGPCTLLTTADGQPLRPAILYGVDTRAREEIVELDARFTSAAIVDRCGSALTSQAVGPKLLWVAHHEPDVFTRARRVFMPSSWLVWHLTGEYVLDHHSASQAVPLYDLTVNEWHGPTWSELAGPIGPPDLAWADDIVGAVTDTAAAVTGLRAGTPVVAGTVDAWAEAISVHAHSIGDLMVMYGTTMFLINTVAERISAPPLWGTAGALAGSYSLAAGMATSGAITAWLSDLAGEDFARLTDGAARSGPGANGLVMLPYFAGERTPIEDADARGTIAGLTLDHTIGDLYRAALEATALGVRHNLEAFRAAGARIDSVVAVGGGTTGGLWTQIVSDVTALDQELHTNSIGACYGAAMLAARSQCIPVDGWNPVAARVTPQVSLAPEYDELYALYRSLYDSTAHISHALARRQLRPAQKGRS